MKNLVAIPKKKQVVQGLQASTFPVVTINNEHAKSRLKRKLRD